VDQNMETAVTNQSLTLSSAHRRDVPPWTSVAKCKRRARDAPSASRLVQRRFSASATASTTATRLIVRVPSMHSRSKSIFTCQGRAMF